MPSLQKTQPPRPPSPNLAFLQAHPLFGAFGPEQIRRLFGYAATRKVARGTTIFAKGDDGNALFSVRVGSVKIAIPSSDGREAVVAVVHEGAIFGEIALLDGQPRTADAVAMTDCELIVINREDFLTFVGSETKVALKIIELLCERLRTSNEHFEEVLFLNL